MHYYRKEKPQIQLALKMKLLKILIVLLTLLLDCSYPAEEAKSKILSSVNEVLQAWSKDIEARDGTMTHAQAIYRELEVVRKVNDGVWPVEAYHGYQLIAAGSGNVDSARLLVAYALDPAMHHFRRSANKNSLHYAAAVCDISLLSDLLSEETAVDDADDKYEMTPLMVAVYFGCIDAVKTLTSEGADVNLCGRHGMNAVMIAASLGRDIAIETLVESGRADVNARHKFAGTTALHMAAELNHSKAIASLCKLGADENMTTSIGSTALHVAAAANAFLSIEPLVTICHVDPNAIMNNDTTALYLSALNGFTKFAEVLLRVGANVSYHMPFWTNSKSKALSRDPELESGFVLNSEPANGAEAIHAAAENGHLGVIKILLQYGADINSVTIGISPIYMAVQYNKMNVVKYLLKKGADVEYPSRLDGSTPLYFAVGAGNEEMVSVLMAAGASPMKANDFDSFPLLYAVSSGMGKTVRKMLNQPGVDINFCTKNGITALHVAAGSGHFAILDYLLKKGSNVHLTSKPNGDTPLHLAVRSGDLDVVRKLVEHVLKIEPYNVLKEFLDKINVVEGCSALHYAVQKDISNTQLVKFLLANGADVNTAIAKGQVVGATPLYIAAANGETDLTVLLLKSGANANFPLDEAVGGYTPLIAAIDRGHTNVVKELLMKREGMSGVAAEPNLGSGRGWTQSPLLLAVKKGYSSMVNLLLSAGANCKVQISLAQKTESGGFENSLESLTDLARRLRLYDVLQILSNHEACADIDEVIGRSWKGADLDDESFHSNEL